MEIKRITRKWSGGITAALCAVSLLATGCRDDKTAAPEVFESGFDAGNLDTSVSPGEDFYRYATGGWAKRNEGKGNMMRQVYDELWMKEVEILNDTWAGNPGGDPALETIARVYDLAFDEGLRESTGLAPLHAGLDRLAAAHDGTTTREVLGELALEGQLCFFTGKTQHSTRRTYLCRLDAGDCTWLSAAEIAVPATVAAYREYIERTLRQVGYGTGREAAIAETVIRMEGEILGRKIGSNDIYTGEAGEIWQAVGLSANAIAYLRAAGVGDGKIMYLPESENFASCLDYLLDEAPVADTRDYAAWMMIRQGAEYLTAELLEGYSALLTVTRGTSTSVEGVVTNCLFYGYNTELGDALYRRIVTPEMLEVFDGIARELRAVFRERIEAAAWLDEPTRAAALEKLDAMRLYAAGHEESRTVTVVADNLYDQIWQHRRRQLEEAIYLAGSSVPFLVPGTVVVSTDPWRNPLVDPNALYFWEYNSGYVFAGLYFLLPYTSLDDPAVNYGVIGYTLAHEMTHAFDSYGRQYDKNGDMNDWWTTTAAGNFNRLAARVSAYYSTLTYGDGWHVDGERTLGECIADLGGLSLALEAMRRATGGDPLTDENGLTADQRFFLAYTWLFMDPDPESTATIFLTDTHVYSPLRINAGVANTDGWYEAFPAVQPGDRWYIAPGDRVGMW